MAGCLQVYRRDAGQWRGKANAYEIIANSSLHNLVFYAGINYFGFKAGQIHNVGS